MVVDDLKEMCKAIRVFTEHCEELRKKCIELYEDLELAEIQQRLAKLYFKLDREIKKINKILQDSR